MSILESKLEEHNLPLRLTWCEGKLAADPADQAAIEQMDAIDMEVTQLQSVKFSLPVKHWVKKRWGYPGLLQLHDGRCRNVGNIKRFTLKVGIPEGRDLIRQQVLDGITYCTQRLSELKPQDTILRKAHLSECVIAATERGDIGRRRGVLRVISSEEQKSIWRTINQITNPPRGGAITRVQKEQGEELVELVTLEDMSAEIQSVMEDDFPWQRAPRFSSLHSDRQ